VKSTLLWTHRAVLSYYLATPGRPVDIRTVSAVIGEGTQAVEQACHDLVQVGVLAPIQSEDALWPLFQLVEQEVERAHMMLAEGMMLQK
jgi:hypothetical protein